MAYSDENDLLIEYSRDELAVLCGGNFDIAQLQRHREYADSIIDNTLVSRYEIPLKMPDMMVTKLSVDLTVAYLYDYAYSDAGVPSAVVWRKLNAFQMLKDIKSGKIDLALQSEKIIPITDTILSNRDNKSITFDMETLDEFKKYIE